MAALLVNKQLWCGAVIIDSDRVLTAAHCLQLQYNNRFFREYVRMLTVRVGSDNATAGGELYRVTEIIFHPNYKPQTLEFNLAVLKLHKNMSFDRSEPRLEKVRYSRDKVVPANKEILFLGWGSVVGIGGEGGAVLLQKVTLPVYNLADCQEIYGRDLVTRSNFCAGYITVAKNVCNHDAGGPALLDGMLVGILSFSAQRCDITDKPAVFTNIGTVSDWLDSTKTPTNKKKMRQH
ncbi:trypsin-like [Amyelois transitella]|uniref:trypsin-like n=1 Tax=Amyelois transitella TaxID=680683 RepID=UPI0029901B6C|nr:trypsin-like [Amyelois transitella]